MREKLMQPRALMPLMSKRRVHPYEPTPASFETFENEKVFGRDPWSVALSGTRHIHIKLGAERIELVEEQGYAIMLPPRLAVVLEWAQRTISGS